MKMLVSGYQVEYRQKNIKSFISSLTMTILTITAQKMKFSIQNFFSKYDQSRRKLRSWSHLLKKSLMENFIICAVNVLFSYW